MVKCQDCAHVKDIQKRNSMGDGGCPHSDKTIIGYVNNCKSLSQPRNCPKFTFSEQYAVEQAEALATIIKET